MRMVAEADITPSKRDAGESQVVDYWWPGTRASYCVSWVWIAVALFVVLASKKAIDSAIDFGLRYGRRRFFLSRPHQRLVCASFRLRLFNVQRKKAINGEVIPMVLIVFVLKEDWLLFIDGNGEVHERHLLDLL